jgi:Reverse transcriptase (RNA-dependent DNA polymerase)
MHPGAEALMGVEALTAETAEGDAEKLDVITRDLEVAMAGIEPFGEPRTLKEAERRPDWPKWQEAVSEKISRLERFGMWELVTPPSNAKIVGCRWVFRLKHNANGDIDKHRGRVVAKGFTQQFGVDYVETFAPVAKLTLIRVIIALAASEDWELHQMDVKSAYLNGELDEDIYMELPPGYSPPNSAGKVCHLLKSLYGLKQAGHQWYQKLSSAFNDMKFT